MAAIPDDAVPVSATALEPVAQPAPAVTVRDLLRTLGPHVVWSAGHDALLDARASEPVVHGAGEPVPEVGGGVVLLTGARADELPEQVRTLGRAGAAAVVVKTGADLASTAAAADAAGVALLATPAETAWRHLDALLTTARVAHLDVGDDGSGAHPPGDLFALANALAGSLGGAVSIEEPSGRVLAYSSLAGQEIDEIRRLGILGRQTPDRPTNAEEYRAIMRAPGPVFFESDRPHYASRLAVAVRAGHQVLGLIFVLCDDPSAARTAELTAASRAVALHLLRARGHTDPDRERRSAVLRGLVDGRLDVAAAADALGRSPDDGSGAVLVVVRPATAAALREVEAMRLADLVALHGEYWSAAAVTAVADGQVLLLLPLAGDAPDQLPDRLHRLGDGVVAAAHRSVGLDVRVAFAPPVSGPAALAGLPSSLRYAEQVLEALSHRPDVAVATLDDVLTAVVVDGLAGHEAARDDALLLRQARAVLDHDAAQGTEYARTLLTHLGSFGDVAETAARLHVHENTARYRVRRLAELFGVDLAGGDETLVLWLQLRARSSG